MTYEYRVQATAGKQSKDCLVVVEPPAATAEGASASRFRVLIDGKEFVVESHCFDRRGDVVSLTLIDSDGRLRIIDLDGVPPDLRISVGGGETVALKVNDRRALSLDSAAIGGPAGSGALSAAMPGKVVKILCQVGDTVKAGQGLLVIEAMKMENELRAQAAGTVAAVAVREGQAVEAGQTLLTLTPQ